MSFGGHVMDMNSRLAQNRAQMKARKARYNRIKEAYRSHVTYKKYQAKECELSKEELDIIKQNIRTKLRRSRIRATIYSTIVTIVISAILLYYLYSKLFGGENIINS